jgi:dTDP-4-dehydrorhamnose 3,5-epimerase
VTFRETEIPGAWMIEIEVARDERGGFARTYDREAFRARGLEEVGDQSSVSFNARAGTLRGLHWQAEPHGECKLIRCTRGAVWDVLLDMRAESPAYGRWVGVELCASEALEVYAPRGVAHGFITLADDTELHYQMAGRHSPEHARGVRWDDPAFGVRWPREPVVMSEADRTRPDHRA